MLLSDVQELAKDHVVVALSTHSCQRYIYIYICPRTPYCIYKTQRGLNKTDGFENLVIVGVAVVHLSASVNHLNNGLYSPVRTLPSNILAHV